MKTSNTINGTAVLSCRKPVYSAPEATIYDLSVEGVLCASGNEGVGDENGSWN